jgi:uncharacterized protein YraI
MRTATLLATASALLLSVGAATAAVTESPVNMRRGPGTQFDVVMTLPAGARFDVADCNNGWCAGAFQGTSGYVSANYLDFGAEAAPGPVTVAPPLYDDYYAEPGIGLYFGPSYYGPRFHRHRHGDWRPGHWRGRHDRVDRPGRPGRPPVAVAPGNQGGPRVSAPTSMPTAPRAAAPAPSVAAPAAPRAAAPAAPAAPAPQQGVR